jgi:F-type H+-transporting ATPase subunit b
VFDLVFPVINFLLFVYLLKRAGGDTIRRYLQERRAQVIAALDAAAAAKAEADGFHAELRERLEQVQEEAGNLRRDLCASAELQRDRRLKGARDAVTRIKKDAQLVAEQEVRAATAALRDETVNAAVAETVALLRRQIRDADQERFLGDFVREVQADR